MYHNLEKIDLKTREEIQTAIQDDIRRALGSAVKEISFDWTHLGENDAQVKITISIEAREDPKNWRRGFAGLTSKIMSTMADTVGPVFPVLMARTA